MSRPYSLLFRRAALVAGATFAVAASLVSTGVRAVDSSFDVRFNPASVEPGSALYPSLSLTQRRGFVKAILPDRLGNTIVVMENDGPDRSEVRCRYSRSIAKVPSSQGR
jgi:hypothetical protein